MKKVPVYPIAVAAILVLAILGLQERVASDRDRDRVENALMQDWYTVRAEAEERAGQDGYVIRSVMSAAMAAATNNIANTEPGSLMDCIDATCRVKTVTAGSMHSVGTGVVFEIRNDTVYVLTNAHVATTKKMKLEFWRDGHKLDAVVGMTKLRDVKRDVAVIAVPVSAFDDYLPTAVPLAPRGTALKDGQMIMSAGCPKATWTRAWIGHVENTKNDRVAFQPGPFGGQSGSALFSADGSEIVALLNLQELGGKNGSIIRGYAVTLENIYIAVYGTQKVPRYSVEPVTMEEAQWRFSDQWNPRAPKGQCGPRGCPSQDESEPAPSQGLGDLLPDAPIPLVIPEIVPDAIVGPDPIPPLPPEPVWVFDAESLPDVEPLPDGVLGVEPEEKTSTAYKFVSACGWVVLFIGAVFLIAFLFVGPTRRK